MPTVYDYSICLQYMCMPQDTDSRGGGVGGGGGTYAIGLLKTKKQKKAKKTAKKTFSNNQPARQPNKQTNCVYSTVL